MNGWSMSENLIENTEISSSLNSQKYCKQIYSNSSDHYFGFAHKGIVAAEKTKLHPWFSIFTDLIGLHKALSEHDCFVNLNNQYKMNLSLFNNINQFSGQEHQMGKKEQRKGLTETAIDTTINVHKLSHRVQFKKKAPRAISEIRKLVSKMMKTQDVRIDPKLNQFVWNQGIRNLPRRVRVRISRKRNEEESKNGSEWYSLVQHVHVENFTGKLTEKAKVSA